MAKILVGKMWGFAGAFCAVILALCGLTGCQTAGDPEGYAVLPGMENVSVSESEPAPAPDETIEIIHIGQTLVVSFADTPTQLNPLEVKVQEDGTVKLYYNERFKCEGLTTTQLEKEVHDRYVPQYFTRLTVMITHARETRYYFIGGEVKQPGQKPYIGPITLTQAIQAAGDYTDWANKKKILLTRANGNKVTVNGKKAIGDSRIDPWIYPGDRILVRRSIF